MIKDSDKRAFDVIIVWKLDRFARNPYDSVHYKNILRKNGVKVMSATEPILDSAEGILTVQKANCPVEIYRKVEFKIVDENDEEYIMVNCLTIQ